MREYLSGHRPKSRTPRGWIKICGIMSAADAHLAVELGANALGFIFAPESPRKIEPELAATIAAGLPPAVRTVGVFTQTEGRQIRELARAARMDTLQLHSDAIRPDDEALRGFPLIKVLQWPRAGAEKIDHAALAAEARPWVDLVDVFLLDTRREHRIGHGLTFDWELARGLRLGRPWLAGGGLRPDNVALAIATLNPWGVDVASGVESEPGVKDEEKLRDFMVNARISFARPLRRITRPRAPRPDPIGYVERLVKGEKIKPIPVYPRSRMPSKAGRPRLRRRKPEEIEANFAANAAESEKLNP